jgi:hypothetical protein
MTGWRRELQQEPDWLAGWLQAFVFSEVFMVQILFLHWNRASASLTYLYWNCSRVCPTVMQDMGTLGYNCKFNCTKAVTGFASCRTKGKQQSSTVVVEELLGSIIMGGHERTHHCCLQIGGALWQIAKGFTIVS